MKTRILSVLLMSVILLAACLPNPSSISAPTGSVSSPATTSVPSVNQGVPPTGSTPVPTHIRVDLTPAQRLAMQALAEKYNIPIEQIELVSTEAVAWTDGCLGVVIPGMMCTQALVDGFRIIFSANGQQYEYHTNQDGSVVIDTASQLAPAP